MSPISDDISIHFLYKWGSAWDFDLLLRPFPIWTQYLSQDITIFKHIRWNSDATLPNNRHKDTKKFLLITGRMTYIFSLTDVMLYLGLFVLFRTTFSLQ
jgi:hypothetical protein